MRCVYRQNYYMNSKYILTNETKTVFGIKLFRIKARISFGNVKEGELGGFVEKEANLSDVGTSWVYGNARVYGDAQVFGNALVYDGARVYGDALVSGNARVYDGARVYGNARVYDGARVYGDALVSGNAQVYDGARVYAKVRLQFGKTDFDVKLNLYGTIRNSIGAAAFLNRVILYKKVNKTDEISLFTSCYDGAFKYQVGKTAFAKECDENWDRSCASGLHCSSPDYWNEGDTLLAVEVKLKDIICCQEGKVRCRKLKVLGVCK